MSTEKTSREQLREAIAAIAEDRRAQAYGAMREVASREPHKVGEALGELAHAASVVASSLAALRENLDLVDAPRSASLRARSASRRRYAAELRRIADADPGQLEAAVLELYRSVDEIAAGLENLASHLGIDLGAAEEEEGMPGGGGGEGFEEAGPEGDGGEGGMDLPPADGLPPGGDAPDGGGPMGEGEEGLKEASTPGSDAFVTDRDESGAPREPQKVPIRTATGGGGFVTDRDEGAEPKPVKRAEIPVSQGEAAIRQR